MGQYNQRVPIAYLSLGSNVGDRAANLRAAIAELGKVGEVRQTSPFYVTEPVEYTQQAEFLNCVVELETRLAPQALMSAILGIEQRMGRVRGADKGPRNIDLDILLYDQQVIDAPGLKVPHPAMHRRRFVLAPLADIAPEARHPVLQRTARELLAALGEEGGAVRIL